MTLWDAYLIFLSRLGLGPPPTAPDGTPLELPSLDSASGLLPQSVAAIAPSPSTVTTAASTNTATIDRKSVV